MEEQVFSLLTDRLIRIEKQNDEQLALMRAHIEKDEKVHRVVDRHSVYFSIFSLGIPALVGYVSKKVGLI